jgi:hypothetical protein
MWLTHYHGDPADFTVKVSGEDINEMEKKE